LSQLGFPLPPQFEESLVTRCRKQRDYRPMLFEWYKHVGHVTVLVASIRPESPGLREIPAVHYSILVGLLNRCARLMLSNTALSSTGLYGETTRLVDRCIVESAVKVMWLSKGLETDRFTRFLADSTRSDLALENEIERSIAARDGEVWPIESRMLNSIEHTLELTGLDRDTLSRVKRMPDMRSIMLEVGLDERAYIGLQRMGSHAIHGNWSDLVDCYLEPDPSGWLLPRDHNVETHHSQFVMVPVMVLSANREFLRAVAANAQDIEEIMSVIRIAWDGVRAIELEDSAADFGRA